MLYIDEVGPTGNREILFSVADRVPRKKSALKAFRPTRLWPAPVLFSTEFSLKMGKRFRFSTYFQKIHKISAVFFCHRRQNAV